ncbi:MAG TPA: phosphatidate cytidylyltransferase, partial [Iamia sp.]|nr:phosphatidate cytidylyltransferase [Iamia sp.]
WAAFGAAEEGEEEEEPRRGRGLFSRRRGGETEPADAPDPGASQPVAPQPAAASDAPEPAEAPGVDDATQVGALPGADAPAPSAEVDPPAVDPSVWAPPEPTEEPTIDDNDADHETETHTAIDDSADDEAEAESPALDEGLAAWGEPSWGADAVSVGPGGPGGPAESAGPLFDADGGWAAGGADEDDDEKIFDFAEEPSGQVALPHWTEPGTGELPRILAGDEDDGVVPGTSGSTPAVHWRSHDGAWAGDDGFADLTEDDDVQLGAMDLDRPLDEDIYGFDELDDVGVQPVAALAPHEDEPGSRRIAPARPLPEPEDHRGGAGRNLGVATAVGLGAAAVAIALLFLGPKFVLLLVVAVLVLAIGEYQAAAQRAGYHPASLLGLTAAVVYPLAVYWKGIEAYPLLAVITIGAALAWHLVGADGDARVVESVGVTLFGIAWVAGLGSFAALLLALPDGRGMLVTAVLAAVGYDVGGLIIGRTMGTRPISDASPNKTVEGLLGGMFMSVFVVSVVVGLFGLHPWTGGDAVKIGLLAMLAAPLGDLCESLVKRDLGVKDMGNLLPEHGGILDRFDGMLFVLPVVFYAAMAWGIHPF